MTTAPPGTTLGSVHMRLVYFQHHDTIESVTPADLARVFHQLDLLVDYAGRITPETDVVGFRGVDLSVVAEVLRRRLTGRRGRSALTFPKGRWRRLGRT